MSGLPFVVLANPAPPERNRAETRLKSETTMTARAIGKGLLRARTQDKHKRARLARIPGVRICDLPPSLNTGALKNALAEIIAEEMHAEETMNILRRIVKIDDETDYRKIGELQEESAALLAKLES
jgi:hypothetical protein